MDENQYYEKVKELTDQQRCYKESISQETKEYFKSINLPKELYDFFEKNSYSNFITFKKVIFDKVNTFQRNNKEILNHEKYRKKYLIIGNGLNGDPIAVNLMSLHVGFIFHDILFEDENADVDEIFVDMKSTISEFYYNSIFRDKFPVDAYQAEEYIKNVSK